MAQGGSGAAAPPIPPSPPPPPPSHEPWIIRLYWALPLNIPTPAPAPNRGGLVACYSMGVMGIHHYLRVLQGSIALYKWYGEILQTNGVRKSISTINKNGKGTKSSGVLRFTGTSKFELPSSLLKPKCFHVYVFRKWQYPLNPAFLILDPPNY